MDGGGCISRISQHPWKVANDSCSKNNFPWETGESMITLQEKCFNHSTSSISHRQMGITCFTYWYKLYLCSIFPNCETSSNLEGNIALGQWKSMQKSFGFVIVRGSVKCFLAKTSRIVRMKLACLRKKKWTLFITVTDLKNVMKILRCQLTT